MGERGKSSRRWNIKLTRKEVKILKKLIVVLMAVALVAGLTPSLYAAISGGAHDFSGQTGTFSDNDGELCKACHTPHGADQSASADILWSQTYSTQTFTMYSEGVNSSTFDGSANAADEPQRESMLCLSCHDGVTTVGNAIGGGSNMATLNSAKNVTTDLSESHPVSFQYGDSDNVATAATVTAAGLKLFTSDDNMECATCHDPHSSSTQLLIVQNGSSALCTTCHTDK